jgi:hypothetical protein
MRLIAKGLLILTVGLLAVGPLAAAPAAFTSSASVVGAGSAGAGAGGWRVLGAVLGVAALGITIHKDLAAIGQKFVTRAGAAQPDYQSGVQAAGPTWEANAAAGSDNWKTSLAQAAARDAFKKGIAGKSSKYQHNASTVGPQRYAQGVANAQSAYVAGIQPVIDTLKSLTLPPKGPRGSAANQARSNAVATALNKMRTGR